MKKVKHSLIALTKISLLCVAFFVLFPSIHVQAIFSDSTTISMGIKLELGTVSLAVTDEIISSVNYSGGELTSIASGKLVNNGSLSTKLAYKVNITKEDGTSLRDEELSGVSVLLNFGTKAKEVSAEATALKTKSFTFVKDANNKDVIIDPNEAKGIPITVNYKSNAPAKAEKLTIEVTFRLIQSNAADANAKLFSDEEIIENTVNLVPKVIEEKSYWPDESEFKNSADGKFTYSAGNNFFSEVYNEKKDTLKKIKNLNKIVIYIKLPSDQQLKVINRKTGEEIDNFKLYITGNSNSKFNIESIKLDEKNRGYKVTLSLLDEYYSLDENMSNNLYYSYSQNFTLDKYNIKENSYDRYTNIQIDEPIFVSRLVLSSDIPSEVDAWNYEQKTIPLSMMEKKIIIKQLGKNNNWVLKSDFKDINLDKEVVNFEVTGDNSGLVNYSVKSKNTFSIKQLAGGNSNNATLNVKITGNTGNTLVISRTLQLQPSLLKMKSVKIPIAPEETKQQVNSEVKVEESSSNIDSTVPNDQISEELIDKDQQKEIIEVNDSSSAENSTEIKEKITTPTEDVDQSTLEEIKNNSIND